MKRRITLDKPGLLIGEGKDEVTFFEAFLRELGLNDRVQVLEYEGKDKLRRFLAELPLLPGFRNLRTLAITRDADDSAAAARRSVDDAITSASLGPLPCRVFVLPDNQKPGALEALWLESLAGHAWQECVDQFFSCLEGKGWEPSNTFAKTDKARAQVWIATKDTPNERFGHAAWHGRDNLDLPWMQERWVDFDHPAFHPLREFLTTCFGGLGPSADLGSSV